MVSKYEHISESWPHHVDKHGRMVPCASNPCKLHSGKGTDLIVTGGPDEAQRIYDYMNELIANINDALQSMHMTMNDELKNYLLTEMRTCYNSNHDFDYFMNKLWYCS